MVNRSRTLGPSRGVVLRREDSDKWKRKGSLRDCSCFELDITVLKRDWKDGDTSFIDS
jgi:hypothetical protein